MTTQPREQTTPCASVPPPHVGCRWRVRAVPGQAGHVVSAAPECPNGHGAMVRRVDPTPLQAEQGEWWDCPPGPPGETCRSSVLVPTGQAAS